MVVLLLLAVLATSLGWPPTSEIGPGEPTSSPADDCGPLELVATVAGVGLCTYGADTHPAGHAASGPTTVADRADQPLPVAPAACIGNGTDGPRVQPLYVRGSSTSSRRSTLDRDLRRWVEQVEWTVVASAATSGGHRQVRWTTEPTSSGCRLTIPEAVVRDAALLDLGSTVKSLVELGYDRADRKYLLFVEADVYCGIGTTTTDDRPSPDNVNDRQPGYGRVDRPCWSTGDDGFHSTAAHELFHTLGAVQHGAPNGTPGRHCSDEWDLMCYADATGVTLRTVCQDDADATSGNGDAHNRLLDCGGDDYFRAPARPGSWLAQHWNTADSVFLAGRSGVAPSTPSRPAVVADPAGRPLHWPTGELGGAHRPLLTDGYGWEACGLPVDVVVEGATTQRSGGLLSGIGGSDQPVAEELYQLASAAVAEVNGGVRTSVLRTAASGPLLVRWGDVVGTHHVSVTTAGARIVGATVTLDAEALGTRTAAARETLVLQAFGQALGIGRQGGTGGVMAHWPRPDASRATLMAALRHLYASGCDVDPRLDDTVGGHPSQRLPAGVRRRLDVVSSGTDAGSVAVAVSQQLRALRGEHRATRAVVCRDDVHADCLGGAALAGRDGVVLFVPGGPDGRLPDAVRDELARAVAPTGEIVILGGTNAVSATTERELARQLLGRPVRRLAGADRVETAARVAAEVAARHGGGQIVLARGDVAADAVAAGAAVAYRGIPVLLTDRDRLPPATAAALRSLRPNLVHVVGGTAAVSERVADQVAVAGTTVRRAAGRSRSETSVAIARTPGLWGRDAVEGAGSVIAVEGWGPASWASALAAAPLGALLQAPVLYVATDDVPEAGPSGAYPGDVGHYLRSLVVRHTTEGPSVWSVVVGTGGAVPTAVAEEFHAAVLPGWDGNVSRIQR